MGKEFYTFIMQLNSCLCHLISGLIWYSHTWIILRMTQTIYSREELLSFVYFIAKL